MSDGQDEAASADEVRLLAEIGRAIGPDALPPGLVERAEGLAAFANIDLELAELLDTAAAEPAGVRGSATTGRPLAFQVADGSIAIEVVVDRDRLAGQVHAGAVTDVDLEHPTGAVGTAAVDDLGRFSFARPGSGPTRLRLWGGFTRPVVTGWFLL